MVLYLKKYTKNLLRIVVWCLLAVAADVHAASLGSARADSLLTLIYDNIFTDYGRAQRYFEQLQACPEVKRYDINHIAGDIALNHGSYFDAVKLYKRALYDRDVADNPRFKSLIIRNILACYDIAGNLQRMDHYTTMLEELSAETGDSVMMAVARFNRGKVERSGGNRERSVALTREAIALLSSRKFSGRLNELCYYYITLVENLQDDRRNREALNVLGEMERVMHAPRKASGGHATEVIDDAWLKDIEAHKAVLFSRLGRPDSAAAHYARFLSSDAVLEVDYRCVLPYLTENGRWADVIDLSNRRRRYLLEVGDSAGRDMADVHKTLGEAYSSLGMYREAALNFRSLDSIQGILKQQENQSAIDELTLNYEARQAEEEQERRLGNVKLAAVLVIALIIILFIGALLMRERHNTSIIRRKNTWMARTIESLQAARESRQAAAVERGETVEAPEPAPPDVGDPDPDSDPGIAELTEDTPGDSVERSRFTRMVNDIVERKLFLDPQLSRDTLLKTYGIPKNKFSAMFRRYASTTYPRYINSLRLDHAVKVMRTHPNYTIDAIARDCGLTSTVTLYNLFSQQYGMTPSEYRKTLVDSHK